MSAGSLCIKGRCLSKVGGCYLSSLTGMRVNLRGTRIAVSVEVPSRGGDS